MNMITIATSVAMAVIVSTAFDAGASAQQAQEATARPPVEGADLPGSPGSERPARKSRLAERKEGELPVNYEFEASYEASRPAPKDNCLMHTGTRVRRENHGDGAHCSGSTGRVYLREDLDADGNMKGGRR